MKFSRWGTSEVPIELVALKLCEEAGEVGKVISHNVVAGGGTMRRRELEHLIVECEHVIFLAEAIRRRAIDLHTNLALTS